MKQFFYNFCILGSQMETYQRMANTVSKLYENSTCVLRGAVEEGINSNGYELFVNGNRDKILIFYRNTFGISSNFNTGKRRKLFELLCFKLSEAIEKSSKSRIRSFM